MARQMKAPPPPSKLDIAARPALPHLFKGTILAVDPSIGSASSMPGYALVVDGVMVDSGILSINPRESASKRLSGIQHQLLALVPNPNVLVIEKIAPMLSCGGAGVIQLHWACGVILATYPDAVPVMIPNQTWKKYLRDKGIEYKKSDENDAIVLMLTLYNTLSKQLKNESDVLKVIKS